MVLAVEFTATLIANMIPTLAGNNYPEDIARRRAIHPRRISCVPLGLKSFFRTGTSRKKGKIHYSVSVYYYEEKFEKRREFA